MSLAHQQQPHIVSSSSDDANITDVTTTTLSASHQGHTRTFSNQGIGSSPSSDGFLSKISKYFKSSTPPTPTATQTTSSSITSPSSLTPSTTLTSNNSSSSSNGQYYSPTTSSSSSSSVSNNNNSNNSSNSNNNNNTTNNAAVVGTTSNTPPDYYQQKQKQLQKKQKKKGTTPKPGTISKVRGASYPIEAISEQIVGVFPSSSSTSSNSSNTLDDDSIEKSKVYDPFGEEGSRRSLGSDNGGGGTSSSQASGNTFIIRNSGNISNYLSDDEGVSESKLEKFRQLLLNTNDDIDIENLRKLSWRGIPSSVRAVVWKVLLGYMPLNRERTDQIINRKRREYLDYVSKYYNEEHLQKTEQETALQKQIHIDVIRTNPDLQLYQHPRIQQALERILYIWSIRHPASGYVQGLNDLVTPFMSVFLYDFMKCDILTCDPDTISNDIMEHMECDSFWCFTQFIDFIQDHYTFAQPGIQRMVNKLEEIIQKIDEPLFNHLQSNGLEFLQFSFRWMNCLLMRELSLKLVVKLFDTYIAEGDEFESFHTYVCAAFLKTWSERLQKMDFAEMVMFLQHLPTRTWTFNEMELLLSQAYMLKVLYDGNNHLNY